MSTMTVLLGQHNANSVNCETWTASNAKISWVRQNLMRCDNACEDQLRKARRRVAYTLIIRRVLGYRVPAAKQILQDNTGLQHVG